MNMNPLAKSKIHRNEEEIKEGNFCEASQQQDKGYLKHFID
jgi:hypothetical protein